MAKKLKKHHHMSLRGKVWYFVGMVKGKRYHEPLSTDESIAMDMRDQYLMEVRNYGDILSLKPDPGIGDLQPDDNLLFGEVATKWAETHEVEVSTMDDYKSSMNNYILPELGNIPIKKIRKLHAQELRKKLKCSNKRKNNIFVPLRCVFQFAFENELIEKNPLSLIKNLKVKKADIYPLSMDEINRFLAFVVEYYRNFFIVAFYTGMRFGEMAVLKWVNVDLQKGLIKVKETRVHGIEKVPKTESSNRDIKILPPVRKALEELKVNCPYKTKYVFMNKKGRNLLPNSINYHVWKPALKKAGLIPRSLYQTRHTYATLMIDGGEHPGWVQKQMGHTSLKMIFDRYYKYIENYKNDDGETFMKNVYEPNCK